MGRPFRIKRHCYREISPARELLLAESKAWLVDRARSLVASPLSLSLRKADRASMTEPSPVETWWPNPFEKVEGGFRTEIRYSCDYQEAHRTLEERLRKRGLEVAKYFLLVNAKKRPPAVARDLVRWTIWHVGVTPWGLGVDAYERALSRCSRKGLLRIDEDGYVSISTVATKLVEAVER